jgi:AcrR family transcriptional regulator
MKVKERRRYDSTSRRVQAQALRDRILDSARRLFSQRGFDTVTIDEIAADAGTSSQTIYGTYKSKAGILKKIIASTFFGAEYEELAARLQTETDLVELLRITAAISRVIFDSEKAEIGILRGASAFSRDLRRVEKKFENMRYELQESRARLAIERYPYAASLGLAHVRDVIWMLTGRDVYRMFVMERGWSSDEYECWLAAALVSLLSGAAPKPGTLLPVSSAGTARV